MRNYSICIWPDKSGRAIAYRVDSITGEMILIRPLNIVKSKTFWRGHGFAYGNSGSWTAK